MLHSDYSCRDQLEAKCPLSQILQRIILCYYILYCYTASYCIATKHDRAIWKEAHLKIMACVLLEETIMTKCNLFKYNLFLLLLWFSGWVIRILDCYPLNSLHVQFKWQTHKKTPQKTRLLLGLCALEKLTVIARLCYIYSEAGEYRPLLQCSSCVIAYIHISQLTNKHCWPGRRFNEHQNTS